MEIFTIIELIILAIFTGYLVYHYSAKDVPLYVKIIVFISWYVNFVTLALIPLDVYFTKTDATVWQSHYNNVYFNKNTIESIWRTIYWTSFILSWIVLPILQEYVDCGEFTVKDKLMKSLKMNLIFYILGIIFGICGAIYLKLSGAWTDTSDISTSLVMIATAFGLLLIISLLGYGLVMIPKRYFQSVNKELNLKFYQFQASLIEDQRTNLSIELENLIKIALIIIGMNETTCEIKVLCNQMISQCPKEILATAKEGLGTYRRSLIHGEIGVVSMAKIITLNQKIKKKMEELRRVECKWEITLENAFFLEDIIESKYSIDWKIRSHSAIDNKSWFVTFRDTLKWIWYVKVQPFFLMAMGIITVFFSTVIVLGEILIFTNRNTNLLSFLINISEGYIAAQLICLIPLFYLSVCVYFALFNVNLAGLYALYPYHQTDAGSLVFSGLNFSRISCPLAYNFLQMINVNGTAFMNFMGFQGISITKAYEYFPWILVILIIFNIFDCYGKILSALGLTQFKFSSTFTDDRIDEGKKLIYKARLAREKNFLSLNSTNLKNYPGYHSKLKMRSSITRDSENLVGIISSNLKPANSIGYPTILYGNSLQQNLQGTKIINTSSKQQSLNYTAKNNNQISQPSYRRLSKESKEQKQYR